MKSIFIIITILFYTAVQADTTNQPSKAPEFYMYGAGVTSCGQWLDDRKNHPGSEFTQSQWVLGYVSGSSIVLASLYNIEFNKSDAAAMLAWVDNYCHENPLDKVTAAMHKLINALMKK